jgi:hypothetical protein
LCKQSSLGYVFSEATKSCQFAVSIPPTRQTFQYGRSDRAETTSRGLPNRYFQVSTAYEPNRSSRRDRPGTLNSVGYFKVSTAGPSRAAPRPPWYASQRRVLPSVYRNLEANRSSRRDRLGTLHSVGYFQVSTAGPSRAAPRPPWDASQRRVLPSVYRSLEEGPWPLASVAVASRLAVPKSSITRPTPAREPGFLFHMRTTRYSTVLESDSDPFIRDAGS